MRRFSQRNSLVTVSEINVTPLLDLAFVLLIIFVITRPLLEQNIDLQLPKNMGRADNRQIDRNNIRLVEITARGNYLFQGRYVSARELEADLVNTYRQNPKLIVDIRADRRVPSEFVIGVLDVCSRHGITQFSVKTAPVENR